MNTIPLSPKDITAEWLSTVLSKSYPGTKVTRVNILDAHYGTTGRAKLGLEYAQAGNQPDFMFAKFPPTDEQQKAFVIATGMGRREAMFYRDLSTNFPARVPACYYSDCNESGDHYLMLLEDLEHSGCSFQNATNQYSIDYVKRVLACFASFHAMYWQSPQFSARLAWVEPLQSHPIAVPLVSQALATYRNEMPPVFAEMAELFIEKSETIHELWRSGIETLVHGDVHDGNLFADGDAPGFLDWALCARASGMRDVAYFLAATLNRDDRQQSQHELLQYYRDQLELGGITPPSQEEMWQQYQWHAAYVWVGATTTLAMGEAWQPISYTRKSLERINHALLDIDSVASISKAIAR
ncbi:MAG: phosphotransferase [Pseudomonadales bacterium]